MIVRPSRVYPSKFGRPEKFPVPIVKKNKAAACRGFLPFGIKLQDSAAAQNGRR